MLGALIAGGALVAAGTGIGAKGLSSSGARPSKEWFGGSPEEMEAFRKRQLDAQRTGAGYVNQGMLGMGEASRQGQGLVSSGFNQGEAGFGWSRRAGNASLGLLDTGRAMEEAGAGLYQRSQADQLAARQAQNQALGLQYAAATGRAPSAAQSMLTSAADQNAQQMAAMAASARGGNQAAAMRGAQAAGVQGQQLAAAQAAQMRAAEMAQARAGLADMAGAQRQQDIGMAGTGLGFYGQGANVQQNATQTMAGIGQGLNQVSASNMQAGAGLMGQMAMGQAQTGANIYGTALDAEVAGNTAQLNNDTAFQQARANANQASKNRFMQFGGQLIGTGGSVMSMGAGGGK